MRHHPAIALCVLLFATSCLPAQGPTVQSINRRQGEVNSGVVDFEVSFDQAMTGVQSSDFSTSLGTVTSVRSAFASSPNCGALDFTSVNHRALCANLAGFPSVAFTVELWCKVSLPLSGPDTVLVSYASPAFDNDLLIERPQNIRIWIAGAFVQATGVSVDDGNWHHVAVTWQSSSGSLQVFKDGVLEYSGTLQAGAQITAGGTMALGDEQDSVGGGFNPSQVFLGSLDECRVWSAVRTPAEILASIANPLTGNESGLVVYWPMDSVQQVFNNNFILPAGINDHSFSQNSAEVQNGLGLSSDVPPSNTYIVTVDTGTELGTLALSLPNPNSVSSLSGAPLNAPFSSGQTYTIVPPFGEISFESVISLSGAVSRVGDFNQDGRPDIAAGILGVGGGIVQVQIFLADGQGGFTAQNPITPASVGTTPVTSKILEVGDVNSDGRLDLVVAGSSLGGTSVFETLYGNGSGGFSGGALSSIPFPGATAISDTNAGLLEDFDDDGNLDFRYWIEPGKAKFTAGLSEALIVYGQAGGAGFASSPPLIQVGIVADTRSRPAFADFNNDGFSDAAVADVQLGFAEVRYGDGSGNAQSTTTLIPQFGGLGTVAGDFNGDGLPDLAVSDQAVSAYLNNGNGTFSAPTYVGDQSGKLAVGDFNGDGHLDIAIAYASAVPGLGISLGNGLGGFGPLVDTAGWVQTTAPDTLEVADFNLDGRMDVLASEGTTTRIYLSGAIRPPYQRNQPAISVDLDGVETDGSWPALVTKAVGETVTWNQQGSLSALSDSVLLAGHLSPRGTSGATTLAGGQVLNIDLSSGQASFLNGGVAPSFVPVAQFSLPFSATVSGLTVSLQSIALDFTNPQLFVLSQGITLDTRPAGPSTVAIPMAEDQFSEIFIPQYRGQAGTIPFYGTRYSRYFINDNGRVSFVAGSTGWGARPEEAQTGPPSIGLWTDFSSQLGTVLITNELAGDRETITYSNVPYWNEQITSTFSISFDATSGAISLDISGVNPNPRLAPGGFQGDAQWLGISPGFCGATLGVPATFSPGFSFSPLLPTDMIYDFWDGQSPGPSGAGMAQSITNLQGGMGTITFSPIRIGNQSTYTAMGW